MELVLWHQFCNSSQDFFFNLCKAALCCVCVCVCSCTIQSSHYSINQQHVSTILGCFTWNVCAMQLLNLYDSLLRPAFWTQDTNITLDTVRNLFWNTIPMKFPLKIQPKAWQFLRLVPDWILKADGSFHGFTYLHAKLQKGPFPHHWPHRPSDSADQQLRFRQVNTSNDPLSHIIDLEGHWFTEQTGCELGTEFWGRQLDTSTGLMVRHLEDWKQLCKNFSIQCSPR
jgi:hypothetical protein